MLGPEVSAANRTDFSGSLDPSDLTKKMEGSQSSRGVAYILVPQFLRISYGIPMGPLVKVYIPIKEMPLIFF